MYITYFQIIPIHISNYISEKDKGGVCVEATHLDTQETGWLYVGHTSHWRSRKELLKNKVKWVISCLLPDLEYSPFPQGEIVNNIKTSLSDKGVLRCINCLSNYGGEEVHIVGELEGYIIEDLSLFDEDRELYIFHNRELSYNQLEEYVTSIGLSIA